MGQKESSEARGVKCSRCQRDLPPNNWKFDRFELNDYGHIYCYYTVIYLDKWYEYYRPVGGAYVCWKCLSESNAGCAKAIKDEATRRKAFIRPDKHANPSSGFAECNWPPNNS